MERCLPRRRSHRRRSSLSQLLRSRCYLRAHGEGYDRQSDNKKTASAAVFYGGPGWSRTTGTRLSHRCSTMTPKEFLSYPNQLSYKELFLSLNTEYLSSPISFKLFTKIRDLFQSDKSFLSFIARKRKIPTDRLASQSKCVGFL